MLSFRENTGKFNPEQFAESKAIAQTTEAEYRKGNEDGFYMYLHRNPVQKFHNEYAKFGQRVHEYWNGPEYQDEANIMGVYPIQEKLQELAAKTDAYEYKYYKNRLDTELSRGEPVFENTLFWNNFSLAFDISRVAFLLLMFVAFIISPVFTQEVKTDMDSIILCSVRGRREIVTAKLLSVCAASAILTAVFFLGMFLPYFPGEYDHLAVMISAVVRIAGFLSLLLVPIGVLWFIYELIQRKKGKSADILR